MKRFYLILICVTIILTSCQGIPLTTTPEQSIPITTTPQTTSEPQEPPVITEYYQKWLDNAADFLSSVKISATEESIHITAESGTLAWSTSYILNALYKGYCASGDEEYIKILAIYLYRIFNLMKDQDGDGYLNWGQAYDLGANEKYEYDEYLCHGGVFLSMASEFVNIIYADPILAKKSAYLRISYKEIADYIVDRSINHVIPAFEKDWNDELGVYMNRPGSVNWHGATYPISLPHNQYLTIVPALINLAKICPEKRTDYLYKAEKMLATFKSYITYKDDGTVMWNYNDSMFEGDYPVSAKEDYSHIIWGIVAMTYGHSNDIVFGISDLEAISKTLETTMFRGSEDEPKITERINGVGKKFPLFLHMFDLGIYGQKIIQRGIQTLIYTETETGRDAPRILAIHPDTPIPRWFDLTLPANNAENVGSTEAFIWQREAYANYYTLQIATDADFTNIIVNRDKILQSSVIVSDLPASSTLYWRVIAKNIKGDETISQTFIFKTA